MTRRASMRLDIPHGQRLSQRKSSFVTLSGIHERGLPLGICHCHASGTDRMVEGWIRINCEPSLTCKKP